MRNHEPTDFLSRLSAKTLPDPTQLTLAGMIKPIDDDASTVRFTRHLTCEKWISLPVGVVDSFVHIRNVSCKEHEHPLVIVRFKRPEDLSQELAFFVSLCSDLQSSRQKGRSAEGGQSRADCQIVSVDEGGGLVLCCIYGSDGSYEVECTGIA